MQFLNKQRSMILNDFGTVSITSLSLIMAQRTRCIIYSVRFLRFINLRVGCDMPEARVNAGAFVSFFALNYEIFYMFGTLV